MIDSLASRLPCNVSYQSYPKIAKDDSKTQAWTGPRWQALI